LPQPQRRPQLGTRSFVSRLRSRRTCPEPEVSRGSRLGSQAEVPGTPSPVPSSSSSASACMPVLSSRQQGRPSGPTGTSKGEKEAAVRLDVESVIWSLRAASSAMWLLCSQLRSLICTFHVAQARCDILGFFFLRCVDWPVNGKLCRCKFQQQEWEQLQKRLGHISLFMFFQPENCGVSLDLAVNEQRRILHFLIKLAAAENPINLKKPRIDRTGPNLIPKWENFVSGIPLSWENIDAIPERGVFDATYMCSMENVRLRVRRRFAGPGLGGWIGLPEEPVELTRIIRWWTVLEAVPQDVIRVLVFLVTDFNSLGDAFSTCDVNGDGKLNHKEFCGQLLKSGFRVGGAGYKAPIPPISLPASPRDSPELHEGRPTTPRRDSAKRKGPGPDGIQKPPLSPGEAKVQEDQAMEALTMVYRFLDASNDGDISLKEFELLQGIWRELWQSMWEFKNHLLECFGSLENAWLVGDRDDSNMLEYTEFQRLCKFRSFNGPVRQIFLYLDKDGDDRIALQEWMLLDGVGVKIQKPN